jgi:hypothetical protein
LAQCGLCACLSHFTLTKSKLCECGVTRTWPWFSLWNYMFTLPAVVFIVLWLGTSGNC